MSHQLRKDLIEFFTSYDRTKLWKVDAIVDQFEEHAEEVMRHLHLKYNTPKAQLWREEERLRRAEEQALQENNEEGEELAANDDAEEALAFNETDADTTFSAEEDDDTATAEEDLDSSSIAEDSEEDIEKERGDQ